MKLFFNDPVLSVLVGEADVQCQPSMVVSNLDSKTLTEREKEEVVRSLHIVESSSKKRGKYRTWSVEQKLEIGSYAIRHGVSSTVSHYSKQLSLIHI